MSIPVPIQTKIDVHLILDAFELGGKKQPTQARVPDGRIFLLAHDYDTYDQDSIPEVYLPGELVRVNENRKAAKRVVAVLPKEPGEIRFVIREKLVGISASDDDLASISFIIQLRVVDPKKLVDRSRGKWTNTPDREAFDNEFSSFFYHKVSEILSDKIQLWSADKRSVKERLIGTLIPEFERYGLRIDSNSLVRRYPSRLSEIALEFARVEQILIDMLQDERNKKIDAFGISPKDRIMLEASLDLPDRKKGDWLFNMVVISSPQVRGNIKQFLILNNANFAANCLQELYETGQLDEDVKFSEQVLISAFRNPLLALGEWLEDREKIGRTGKPVI